MTALHAALHADTAASADLDLFGRFVGSWRLDWERVVDGAVAATAVGELHFGWVLGGRAVQDVWIVPGPDQPGTGERPHAFHGSTIRFYDDQLGAWRSTWVEPVNGRVRRFVGRPVGDEIELRSDEDEPALRWRFTAITPDSFTWLGEVAAGPDTWELEERMHATRVL